MCKFKSAIVTRQGEILEHWNTDSHEDLVSFFNLRDNDLDHFCRVEFSPVDMQDLCSPEKYVLTVDEKEVPAWFEDFREKAETHLRGNESGTKTNEANRNERSLIWTH